MRIGLIAPPWIPVPPVGYGGAEVVIDLLARGLVDRGHEVRLWTTGDATCPVRRGHVFARGDPSRIGDAGDERRHVVAAYDALTEWGADVVHDHTVTGPAEAARRGLTRVVASAHVPLAGDRADDYRAVAGGVPIVAVSRSQAAAAPDVPVAAVIPHAVDLARHRLGDGRGDDRGPYLAFVGRMVPEKGPQRALMAARRAGMRLRLAAKMCTRAERDFFHREVRPLLDGDREFVGELVTDERIAMVGGASALLAPIAWPEPFGLVMAEALACGTPVLAYDCGAAGEIVDDGVTGFLCDDVAEMASAVSTVETIDRGACRAAAEARFSAARMVAAHVALYEALVAGG